jgi:futalosine hydrolase
MTRARTSTGSPTLVLLPTELERRRFVDLGGLGVGHALLGISGFGPVAAAARTSQLVATLRPVRVLLVGIAGAYDGERHPVGEALAFSSVAVEGIGAGRGEGLQAPSRLGFPQWPGSEGTAGAPIEEVLSLHHAPGLDHGRLLTTCAASDSPEHAALRIARHPDAVAEDMEGFSVALACALAGVPLAIVRGISNVVGDREPTHWRIPAALAAARRLAIEVLAARWRREDGED